jgi:hypothetical protein
MPSFKLGQLIPLGIASTHELLVLLVQLHGLDIAPAANNRSTLTIATYRLICTYLDSIRRFDDREVNGLQRVACLLVVGSNLK